MVMSSLTYDALPVISGQGKPVDLKVQRGEDQTKSFYLVKFQLPVPGILIDSPLGHIEGNLLIIVNFTPICFLH